MTETEDTTLEQLKANVAAFEADIGLISEPNTDLLDDMEIVTREELVTIEETFMQSKKKINFRVWLQDAGESRTRIALASDYTILEEKLSQLLDDDWYDFIILREDWYDALRKMPLEYPLLIAYGQELTSDNIDCLLFVETY